MAIDSLDGLDPGVDAPSAAKPDDMYSGYVDYFGFDDKEQHYLPDNRQWLELKKLNEGDRAKYESSTSKDIRINRRTEDATLNVNQSIDRQALLRAAITNWNLVTRNNAGKIVPVPFGNNGEGSTLNQWIQKADPSIINKVVDHIRKMNPWLTGDMTVEMIDEEIERLNELRQEIELREASEKNS